MTSKPNIAEKSLPGSKLLRACDCFTVFCRHNMRELSALTRWERFKLFFIRGEVHWDSEEGVVSLWKRMGGVLFLVKQEPIEYGDPRNAQIDRFHGWFS